MKIEAAIPADSTELTRVTKLSKAYWGFSAAQLLAWDADLTITESYFEQHQVYKLIESEKLIGYYSFRFEEVTTVKLDNLFVHPDWIGKGFGKKLMTHFLKQIKATNCKRIILDSDPNAEKFYLKLGFQTIGQLQSSVSGRFLPIMEMFFS